jgi:hypothetical protein
MFINQNAYYLIFCCFVLQIPKGVTVPCFLEEVCTPLLRAGQQLQVLSKLLDAPSASKIVDSPFKSSGSLKDTILSFTCWSDTLLNKSTSVGSVLDSSKTDTHGDAQQPKRFIQMPKEFPDVSFARLAKSPTFQQETERSGIMGRTVSANYLKNLHVFLFIMFQSANANYCV